MNRPPTFIHTSIAALALIAGLALPALAEDNSFAVAVEIRPKGAPRPTQIQLELPTRLDNGKTTPVQVATSKGSGLGSVELARCAAAGSTQTLLAEDLFVWQKLEAATARSHGRNWLAVFEQPSHSSCRMTLSIPMSVPGIEGSDIGSGG